MIIIVRLTKQQKRNRNDHCSMITFVGGMISQMHYEFDNITSYFNILSRKLCIIYPSYIWFRDELMVKLNFRKKLKPKLRLDIHIRTTPHRNRYNLYNYILTTSLLLLPSNNNAI